MKQRLITLGFAAAALLLFYLLFLPHPTPITEQVKLPTSVEADSDGLLAVWRWLASEGVPVLSLRERYDQLPLLSRGASRSGNLLLTSMPFRLAVSEDEWQALEQWVQSGNTLLILAALDDTPRWSVLQGSGLLSQLKRVTRLQFSPVRSTPDSKQPAAAAPPSAGAVVRELASALQPTRIDMQPRGQHPLLNQIQRLEASSDLPADRWQATPAGSDMTLALAERTDSHAPVLWLQPQGRGQVVVLSVATPFSNQLLDHADNARLLVNLLAWSRAAQGRVIFDDAHQGLVSFYDPQAFFRDPRLYHTLGWLLLLWLAYVLGPLRLRDTQVPWQPMDETGIIEASGRFFSAAVPRSDAARRLFENFFNRLRQRLGMIENGAPLWDWLAAQAAVSNAQRAELQRLFAQAHAGEPVRLLRLQNLLATLQEEMA